MAAFAEGHAVSDSQSSPNRSPTGATPPSLVTPILAARGFVDAETLSSCKADDGSGDLLTMLFERGGLTAWQAGEVRAGRLHGLTIGRYRLLERLGRGGMGEVYRAQHRIITERIAALKLLKPELTRSQRYRDRFLREATACLRLDHPNIVRTYDVDEADGQLYMAMELLAGEDLATHVKRVGPLPVEQALSFIDQAAAGLEYAHKMGIRHRDIKPSNLFLTQAGTIKVIDFGLALVDAVEAIAAALPEYDQATEPGDLGVSADLMTTIAKLTGVGAIIVTLPYMSPEQAQAASCADERSDMYSLGCTLFYLVTGQRAFAGDSPTEMLTLHQHGKPRRLRECRPDVADPVATVTAKMIHREPDLRFPSMAELRMALKGSKPRRAGPCRRGSSAW